MTAITCEQVADRSGWLDRYRSALAHRDLRRLFGALVVSATGSWAYNVALLAFLFERTHSLGWVGAAGLARFVPQLLLSTYGGVVAERVERIRLMVGSDLLSALFQAGLAAVAVADGPPALALMLAVLTAVATVVYQPATAATIPSIVSEDELAAANALNGTIDQLVVITGPAIGALLLLAGTPAMVFALNAASFILSAALVSRINVRSHPVDVTEDSSVGPFRQMLVGFQAIVRLPAARILVAYCVLVSFLYGTDTVLFVGVSTRHLGTGAKGFGYLLAGLGVGGILMAPAVDRLAGRQHLGPIILTGAFGYALPTALLTVIHTPALAFGVEVVRGGATLVVDVLAITALQRAVPREQLARAFGVFFALVLTAIALGTVLTPIIVHAFGLNAALWVMALAPVPIALAGYPALRAVDRQTAGRARALEPTVALLESLALFAGASRPILERLAAAATANTFAPGAAIISEGDPADALYIVAQGKVEVSVHGAEGAGERQIAELAAPDFFGEIGLLEGIPRTATVTAVDECTCERIGGDTFLEALTASPPSTALAETARGRLALAAPSRRASSRWLGELAPDAR